MNNKNGFTMAEIIVVTIIVGVLFAVALPNYYNIVNNLQIENYEHNLIAIANAQQKYYRDHGYYCGLNPGGAYAGDGIPGGCGGDVWTSTVNINQGLNLNLPQPKQYPGEPNYYCFVYPAPNPGFICTANTGGGTNQSNNVFMSYNSASIAGNGPTLVCQHQGMPFNNGWSTFACP